MMHLQRYSLHMLRLIVASFLWLSFSIGLLAADEDTFVLVGSVSQLQDGDEVLIVNRESCLALSLDEKTNYVLPCNVDLSADGTEATVVSPNTAVLTLEKMSLGFRQSELSVVLRQGQTLV